MSNLIDVENRLKGYKFDSVTELDNIIYWQFTNPCWNTI